MKSTKHSSQNELTHLIFVGFGAQTQSWIQNLRDSGLIARVYLRPHSPSQERVEELQFKIEKDLSRANILFLLIPDSQHLSFLSKHSKEIRKGTIIIYAHGASQFEHNLASLFPQFHHCLLAIKSIASEIRHQFLSHGKLGAVYSTEFTSSSSESKESIERKILNIAKKLGVSAGPFPATFQQEAQADLFSEQSLLCGLIPYAAKQSYEILRQRGIPKELAFMECWLEVKLIADAMIKRGPQDFFQMISPHALLGSELAQEKIFDQNAKNIIENLCDDIWNKNFFTKINQIDENKIRKTIINRWTESEIHQVYNERKEDLIP